MSVAQPLALLLLLPAGAAWLWLRRRGEQRPRSLPGDWGRAITPPLRRFMAEVSQGENALPLKLLVGLWILLAIALARPGITTGEKTPYSNLGARVIVLDLSGEASIHEQRLAARRLLDSSPDVPTGVVVATGDAFDAVPLTTDRAFIDRYLDVIHPDVMPLDGRALHLAVAHSQATLTRARVIAGQIVVVSAGDAPARALESALWRRALVVPEAARDAWRDYASDNAMLLATTGDVGDVVDALQSDIERASFASDRAARLDLTPYVCAGAALLWLLLFRRRRAS